MRYYDLYDHEPEPEHPAKRARPRDITSLYVHTAEWDDFRRICKIQGAADIVSVRKVPIIQAHDIDVLCKNADAAMALSIAWGEFCKTSPHRPHSKEDAIARGERQGTSLEIPRDWRF